MKKASHRIVAGALILSMSLVGTGFPLPNPAVGKAVEAGKSAPRKEVGKANTWLAGKLMVARAATINGKKAPSGTTVFSENRIAVANTAGNLATITLGGLGRLDLQPGTELVLRFADGLIGGELLAGEAVIRSNAGVKVALRTPVGLVTADGRTATATFANTQGGSPPPPTPPTTPTTPTTLDPVNPQGGGAPPGAPGGSPGGGGGGAMGGGGATGGGGGFGGGGGLAGLLGAAGVAAAIGISAATDDEPGPACVIAP